MKSRISFAVQALSYTVVPCELGFVCLAATEEGICFLSFGDEPSELEKSLLAEFGKRDLQRSDATLGSWAKLVADLVAGKFIHETIPLDMKGTEFQHRVWNVLKSIPAGETRTYQQIARQLGDAKLVRAVARACATNPVSMLVPCHRVVKSNGGLAGYRWGIERKRKLLEIEKQPA